MISLLQYKKALREDCMRKYLVIMIVILIFGVPYIAVAGDYDSGVKATLILKTNHNDRQLPCEIPEHSSS